MKQLLTSVVREICTLRSVGAGVRATVPGHPVLCHAKWYPYRDQQLTIFRMARSAEDPS